MAQLIAILCVFGLVLGQVLFKYSAISLSETGSFFATKTMLLLFIAFAVYGVTTLAWVVILQKLSLGQVYPFTALAFVLVPLASYFLFGEKFQVQYYFGVALIIAGIAMTIHAGMENV